MFNAACAPIASDTTHTSAAAMVRERREMRNGLTFIAITSWYAEYADFHQAGFGAQHWSRRTPDRFCGGTGRSDVQLCSICGTAAKEALTCRALPGNLIHPPDGVHNSPGVKAPCTILRVRFCRPSWRRTVPRRRDLGQICVSRAFV